MSYGTSPRSLISFHRQVSSSFFCLCSTNDSYVLSALQDIVSQCCLHVRKSSRTCQACCFQRNRHAVLRLPVALSSNSESFTSDFLVPLQRVTRHRHGFERTIVPPISSSGGHLLHPTTCSCADTSSVFAIQCSTASHPLNNLRVSCCLFAPRSSHHHVCPAYIQTWLLCSSAYTVQERSRSRLCGPPAACCVHCKDGNGDHAVSSRPQPIRT